MVSASISTEFYPERVWSDEDYKKLLYEILCYVNIILLQLVKLP